jgi:macrodomain Ter protein organizer (MatP/YcbG family)
MKNTKQGFTGFDDLSGVDSAVESLLDQGQRRNVESHLPKTLRSQRKKERERAQKRLANRVNLDLPVDLKKRLDILAKKEGVPVSQLVAFLLYGPVHQLETRMISLWGYKTSSGCRKFEWNIDIKRYAEEVLRNCEKSTR